MCSPTPFAGHSLAIEEAHHCNALSMKLRHINVTRQSLRLGLRCKESKVKIYSKRALVAQTKTDEGKEVYPFRNRRGTCHCTHAAPVPVETVFAEDQTVGQLGLVQGNLAFALAFAAQPSACHHHLSASPSLGAAAVTPTFQGPRQPCQQPSHTTISPLPSSCAASGPRASAARFQASW